MPTEKKKKPEKTQGKAISTNKKISVFGRYLILLILALFSYLFYLSTPALYDYGLLQKDLTKD